MIDLSTFGVDASALPDQRPPPSQPFEPYLELRPEADANEMDLLLDDLCTSWLSGAVRRPGIQKQQNFIDCMRVILLNLLNAAMKDPNGTVGISKNKERLQAEQRYLPDFMTTSYFLKALEFLERATLIDCVLKGYRNDGLAQVSRYMLTAFGRDRLLGMDLSLSDFRRSSFQETVHLKDASEEKRLIPYKDTRETERMRAALERFNAMLNAHQIEAKGAPRSAYRAAVLPKTKRLYRVFNNGTFEQGGRFYGGWWQVVKGPVRKYITIDGQQTIEADYRGLFPAILFAKHGQAIPDDPYALVPGVAGNPALREHAKDTFNALLQAKGLNTKEPSGFDEAIHGMSAKTFRQSVVNSYPMLPNVFGSGVGMFLFREESDLAEKIMMKFISQQIPILPIHDAFIVQSSYKDLLVQVMQDTFQQEYGIMPTITVK